MTETTLKIKTTTVEIKTIRVGNQKMTKATFRQIIEDDQKHVPFDDILGWVVDNGGTYLLWYDNGDPYLTPGLRIRRIGWDDCIMWGNGEERNFVIGACDDRDLNNNLTRNAYSYVRGSFDQLFIAT